jgi:hypothetical protein
MILFFDLCDYGTTGSTSDGGSILGCYSSDLRYSGASSWADMRDTAIQTKDAWIKACNELRLTLVNDGIGTTAFTGLTSQYLPLIQTVTGLTSNTGYTDFWSLTNTNMDGLTEDIYNNYIKTIDEAACALNNLTYFFSGEEALVYWEYPDTWRLNYFGIACCYGSIYPCGDNCVDLEDKLTTNLDTVDDVEEFANVIGSELIDVRNRQSIRSYGTLRMLYDRYNVNSLDFSANQSSQYDYFDMDNFGKSVGGYWVDLIEQVVPATTIWESTYTYRNTVFDTQKYKYRKNNIYFSNPSQDYPFSAISTTNGATGYSVDVIVTNVTFISGDTTDQNDVAENKFGKLPIAEQTTLPSRYDNLWTMQSTCSPEFLGTVDSRRNYFSNRS